MASHAARLVEAAEVGGIAPDLARIGGVDPDELEVGPLDELAEGMAPDIAGRELDHPQRHHYPLTPGGVPTPCTKS